jgi:hypothetical protein
VKRISRKFKIRRNKNMAKIESKVLKVIKVAMEGFISDDTNSQKVVWNNTKPGRDR